MFYSFEEQSYRSTWSCGNGHRFCWREYDGMECFNCRWKRNPLSLESADSSYQTRLCLHEAQKRREILRRSCSVRVVFFFFVPDVCARFLVFLRPSSSVRQLSEVHWVTVFFLPAGCGVLLVAAQTRLSCRPHSLPWNTYKRRSSCLVGWMQRPSHCFPTIVSLLLHRAWCMWWMSDSPSACVVLTKKNTHTPRQMHTLPAGL